MCGRSSLHDAPVNVLERFQLPPVLPGFKPRYNIAPSEDQWVIALDDTQSPRVAPMRWGLIPSWASDAAIGNRLINARAESLALRPAFRDLVGARRCLVLTDGYYEWSGKGRHRVPFFFQMRDSAPFTLAGLWDRWSSNGNKLETCVVITTDPSPLAARVHDRMPAILDLDASESWLSLDTPPERALALLAPYTRDNLDCHQVSKLVNTPAHDSPQCMEPVADLFGQKIRPA